MSAAYASNVAVARLMQQAYGAEAMAECETRLDEALDDLDMPSIATWIAVYVILGERALAPEVLLGPAQPAD